ncbi:hypothetical protein [Absidia glauca]|uniref:HMG box domain-containing protein n=1 Tax=Absidia glauca TaxID=4829 RepID=A0A163M2R0_ABSGL|nr:hypothetical protein [Absidia glauca]
MSTQDVDASIIKKYDQLKKRVLEIEQDNSDIHTKLVRAKKHVKRLRMERLILLEQLDEYYTSHKDQMETSESDDSDASGVGSMAPDARKQHKIKRARHNDKTAPTASGNAKHTATKSQEPTLARKKKDPNAPKGPGNVFFLYCRMERGNFKDELPTENLGEVTRLLGQKWKAMTDDEKKKYYDIYDKEQEEYQKAMKSYTEAGGGDAGRIAVSEMIKAEEETRDFEDVDMIRPDDEDDLDDDLDEEDEEGSFMDDTSVATTNDYTSAHNTTNNNPAAVAPTISPTNDQVPPSGPITNITPQ